MFSGFRAVYWVGAIVLGLALLALAERRTLFDPSCARVQNAEQSSTNSEAAQNQKKDCTSTMGAGLVATGVFLTSYKDQINAASTLVIALFTVILGIFTIFLTGHTRNAAIAARDAANIANRTLVASNRPWVRVEAEIRDDGLVYKEDACFITLIISLKNVGKSPALGVWVNAEMYNASGRKRDHLAEQQRVSREGQIFTALRWGQSIFPDQTIKHPVAVSISAAEVQRLKSSGGHLWPVIVGCVEYRSPVDDDPHQTGFILMPREKDPTNPRRVLTIDPAKGNIASDNLILMRTLSGGHAT